MYCKLLKEVVDEISGGEIASHSTVDMKVDIDAYLDSEYIPSNDEKIKVYKDIAELKSTEEQQELYFDLKDRYGEPNDSLMNLMNIAVIKNMASQINAKKVEINSRACKIYFDASVLKNQNVIFAVSDMADECVFSIAEEPTLVFNAKLNTIRQKLDILLKFLKNVINNCKNYCYFDFYFV